MPFYWNPHPVAFTIPLINLPIYTYAICFVTGFILGYYLLLFMMRTELKELSQDKIRVLLDQLTWFVVGGTILGARLGHVVFYDWDHYKDHLWRIFNTREGGLASHGGAIGVLLALIIYYYFFFHRQTKRSFLELLDMAVVPTALVGMFIRIGNFFNQEILGTTTKMPWAVVFGSPAENVPVLPRHPAQLYEGFAYLGVFIFLFYLWKSTNARQKSGLLSGLFFILVFGSRFLIEYFKVEQSSIFDQTLFQAGQLLSIPFIITGIILIGYSFRYNQVHNT